MLISFESYSCECVHIASSFTKRIKQTDNIVLGQILNELPNSYLEIEIIKDYSNEMNTKSVLLFNGGGIDCLRDFSDDIGKYMTFALNRHSNSTEEHTVFEVTNCIESALYLDKDLTCAEGNITRFNSFYSQILFSFSISFPYELMENRTY